MDILRRNITVLNLCVTGTTLLFFTVAPALGFPASWNESLGLSQIITPVFLGNIGFAAAFAAQTQDDPEPAINNSKTHLISILAYGAIIVFGLIAVAACVVFWVSNRSSSVATGTGMGLSTLQTSLTAALGVSTATSNHLLARLFPHRRQRNESVSP